jgi:hypothetical protein
MVQNVINKEVQKISQGDNKSQKAMSAHMDAAKRTWTLSSLG